MKIKEKNKKEKELIKNPIIQMRTPTMEISREMRAKGRPNKKAKGLQLQSIPGHILLFNPTL